MTTSERNAADRSHRDAPGTRIAPPSGGRDVARDQLAADVRLLGSLLERMRKSLIALRRNEDQDERIRLADEFGALDLERAAVT